ncbi:MAG: glycosyltransferase family 4 protein [Microcoleus vaginatus WJT46-NPBG5]|jgi:UDP-N-acetylmuramyl pentapeptide phosphotransferase/UDP-N-acetylglucosamine-1-phosphate transferase|nr:glycosyltransferase family 4 protein [Microcoleus vaginatus WJT46-NPBG5]
MYLILVLASFLLSLLSVGLIKQRFNQQLLDIPNERSSHTQPTPRGGGLGFIIAFALTSGSAAILVRYFSDSFPNQLIYPNLGWLWLILIPLAIVGIIDDQRGVPAGVRYLVQLGVSGIAVACFGPFPQPWLTNFGIVGQLTAIALTVVGMTALINFYNFMDGLDGLVAGVSAVQLSFLAIYVNQPILWLIVAALLGFLWWNWSPAKIFMGDAGSTVLGAIVAISLFNTHSDAVGSWSALAITLPLIADAIYTLARRLIRRENIFKAHRTHLYQKLQQSGWSHAQVASTYIGITVLVAGSIYYLGPAGAWLSLVGIAGAIIVGETYLRTHSFASK